MSFRLGEKLPVPLLAYPKSFLLLLPTGDVLGGNDDATDVWIPQKVDSDGFQPAPRSILMPKTEERSQLVVGVVKTFPEELGHTGNVVRMDER